MITTRNLTVTRAKASKKQKSKPLESEEFHHGKPLPSNREAATTQRSNPTVTTG
jgi:hypothetical protein